MTVKLKPNEVILKASTSFHLPHGQEKTEGKLILTNQRVYFKLPDTGEDEFLFEIRPVEIRDVFYFKTGWFSQNGLTISARDGRQWHFELKKRDNWGEAIARMC